MDKKEEEIQEALGTLSDYEVYVGMEIVLTFPTTQTVTVRATSEEHANELVEKISQSQQKQTFINAVRNQDVGWDEDRSCIADMLKDAVKDKSNITVGDVFGPYTNKLQEGDTDG